MLEKEAALNQIVTFVNSVKNAKYRQKTIVDVRNIDQDIEIILIGDLHTKKNHLIDILAHDNNEEKIKQNKAILIILGDAVHDEDDLRDMDTSIEIMQFIMDLKIKYPDNVYYMIGNHDYLSEYIVKGFIYQGLVYEKELMELYGNDYIEQYKTFIRYSPILAIGDNFVAVHAGPTKTNITMDNIMYSPISDERQPIINALIWNRFDEDYNLEDVNRFLTNLDSEKSTLIVAHNRMDKINWHWELADNHHIIFAANSKFGYAVIENDEIRFIDC